MPDRLFRLVSGALVPLCLAAAPLSADAGLSDPQIPHGERVVHTSYVNDTRDSQEELVELFDAAGEKIYRYTATKSDRTIVAEIVAKTMTAGTVTVTTRDSTATVRQSVSLVAKHRDLKADEIGILEFFTLRFLLRGYPFESKKSFKLRMLGQTSSFPVTIQQAGRETLTVGGKSVECYRLTLAVSGIMGTLLPKTLFWYSTEKPHYLVRYEGLVSGPGSPKKRLEAETYTVTGKGR